MKGRLVLQQSKKDPRKRRWMRPGGKPEPKVKPGYKGTGDLPGQGHLFDLAPKTDEQANELAMIRLVKRWGESGRAKRAKVVRHDGGRLVLRVDGQQVHFAGKAAEQLAKLEPETYLKHPKPDTDQWAWAHEGAGVARRVGQRFLEAVTEAVRDAQQQAHHAKLKGPSPLQKALPALQRLHEFNRMAQRHARGARLVIRALLPGGVA